MTRPPKPPAERRKPPEELLREAVNAAGVAVVKAGFDAIDELAERGTSEVKKFILQQLTSRVRKPAK
jgi:hypothetical protein